MNQIISFAVLNREFDGACVHIKHFCGDRGVAKRGTEKGDAGADGVMIAGCGGRVVIRDERGLSRDRAEVAVAVFMREMIENGFVVSGTLSAKTAKGAAIH